MSHPPVRAKVAHFTDRGHSLHGVVHVGANDGEEIPWYLHMGHVPVLGFEPVPAAYALARSEFGGDARVELINAALGGSNRSLQLHVDSTGTHKGSSRFVIPGWAYGGTIMVPCHRFDLWAGRRDLSAFDTLVIDVEGMELEVLEGFGVRLNEFDFLNIECSETPIFDGQAPASSVVDFVASRGFRLDSPIESHNDVMFIREN
jgi:FkbM family methyltransferase